MNIKKACVVGLVLAASSVASAGTYYISPVYGDDDAGDGLSMETAFKSLSKVFGEDGVAKSGRLAWNNEIVLSNGVYKLDWPLTLNGTTVRGWSGNAADVVLDAQGKTNCIYISYTSATVRDLTVCNGQAAKNGAYSVAGGISTMNNFDNANMVSNCVIRDCVNGTRNETFHMGGGLYAGPAKVFDCRIENCHIIPENVSFSGARAHGGGVCFGRGSVVRGLVVTNCSIVATSGTTLAECRGGGVAIYTDAESDTYLAKLTECAIVGCSITNASGTGVGGGGGIGSRYGEFHDVLVSGCLAQQGGGLLVANTSWVYDCVITNNQASGNGGGIYVSGVARNVISGSVICDNLSGTSEAPSNGGGVYMNAKSTYTTFADTVFRGNKGASGAGIYYSYGCQHQTFSNCVFEANIGTTGGDSGAISFSYGDCEGLGVYDTIFKGNKAGTCCVMKMTGSGTANNVFQNCLFRDNLDLTDVGCVIPASAKNDSQKIIFDHCTMISNNVSRNAAFFRSRGGYLNAQQQSNVVVHACVMAGNGSSGNYHWYFATDKGYAPMPGITYSSFSGNDNWTKNLLLPAEVAHNTINTPLYLAADGSGRPTKASTSIVDIDTSAVLPTDWAAVRKRTDLGDGTYTLEPNGKYALKIVHNGTGHQRRWSGSYPDVGCFELYQPLGLMLLFK